MTTTPKVSTKEPNTVHVTRLFRTATSEDLDTGLNWYNEAFDIAERIATEHSLPISTVAGIIAALSPRNTWGYNVKLAERFVMNGGLESGYMSMNLNQAQRIFDGEFPLVVLGGAKTRNFYLSIASRGVEGICIDRHAWDVVTNERNSDESRPPINVGRYRDAADKYQRAAMILSKEYGPVSAAQVQSTTWVLWRNRYWKEGVFDVRD